MDFQQEPREFFGGSQSSGYIQRLMAEVTAKTNSIPFDMDRIRNPSKHIQNTMYEHSTRIRTGVEKLKTTLAKNTRNKALSSFIQKIRNRVGVLVPSTPDEMEEWLNTFKREGVEGISYSASRLTGDLMFLHLLRKYKNECFIVQKEKQKITNAYDVGLTYRSNDNHFSTIRKGNDIGAFIKSIKTCIENNSPLIIIPFSLYSSKGGHQNMLIYRPLQNTLERYEPHGIFSVKDDKKLDRAILLYFIKNQFDDIFRREGVPEFKYIRPLDLGFEVGFQKLENREARAYEAKNNIKLGYQGFCQAWSFFYLELVLKFPNLTGAQILNKAFDIINKRGGVPFLQHIGGYVEDFEKEMKKLISDFSFASMDEKYFEWYEWFDNEIAKELSGRKGGHIICSCDK
jgi:hypothetical protein